MADSTSASGMDYWRGYFRSSNADIFETIKKAIIVAASDHPEEFRTKRDSIAQTLFSCKMLKCSGCDKLELAFPVDDQQLVDENKGQSLRVDADKAGKKHDGDDDDHRNPNVNNQQMSKFSYQQVEALTDVMDEVSEMHDEVLRIKALLDNRQDQSESELYNLLRKLELMALSVDTLKATEIGKSVNGLRKHRSKNISQLAKMLIEMWKGMVDEWVASKEKATAAAEATPESLNPSVLDEEEGLPSPPLEDLAFLYPHTSMELSAFFDGVDDYESPASHGELNKNRDAGRKMPKQQKPLTEKESESDVKKVESSMKMKKPIAHPVADSGPGRQMKPNSEKPTVPKRPPPQGGRQQTKPDETSAQDKFEATKRKLQERYQQAEKAKKQRTIQVMELHDLPKQNLAPRSQNGRPGNNHNRHTAGSRRAF